MHTTWFIVLATLLCFGGCARDSAHPSWDVGEIAGAWKGRLVAPLDRPYSELILLSLRADSSLEVPVFFELGPRSRVVLRDHAVEVQETTVRWDENRGVLNATRDTMRVTREEDGWTTRWVFVRDRSADSLMARLHREGAVSAAYRIPEERNDGWRCADAATLGIDTVRVLALIDQIIGGQHDDIHSLLIVKDNALVVEEYFAGNGSKHGPFINALFRDKVHHLASTTKCVTSTLVGIAIDQGCIGSADDPIRRYLPAYDSLFTGEKQGITIRHMLTMTPGFAWRQFGVSDEDNDGMRMWAAEDVIAYVLRKPLDAAPGVKHNYTNGVPTVVGAILENATGMDATAFAEVHLFRPLEISAYTWTSYPDGSLETDGGLALSARDLAKIGQLFLDHGVWNGKVVVSERWVRESTRERLRFGRSERWGYGYYWMQANAEVQGRSLPSFFAPGDGNQILAVFPQFRMVVVMTAGNYGRDPKSTYYSLFEDFILPAVIPDTEGAG